MPVDPIRQHLTMLLNDGNAHSPFDDVVADFPSHAINQVPPHTSYSPWHLLEHMRLTQRDILNYIESDTYEEQPWPEGYWPNPDATADEATWNATIDAFREDLAALTAIAEDESRDLHLPVKNAQKPSHTLLRQLIVVGKHNSYHLGEFGILRQVMNTWGPDHE